MAVRDDEKVGYPEMDTFSLSTWLFLSLGKQRETGVWQFEGMGIGLGWKVSVFLSWVALFEQKGRGFGCEWNPTSHHYYY